MNRLLSDRFIEDRALRDAARAVLEDDIARLRESLTEQSVASRVTSSVGGKITGRIKDGASDLLEQAKAQANDHRGVLALLVGAILLWFGREPILSWFDPPEDNENDTEAASPAADEGDPE